jgi:hypothetical protein
MPVGHNPAIKFLGRRLLFHNITEAVCPKNPAWRSLDLVRTPAKRLEVDLPVGQPPARLEPQLICVQI